MRICSPSFGASRSASWPKRRRRSPSPFLLSDLITAGPSNGAPAPSRARRLGAAAVAATALGLIAVGALSIGALSVGVVRIGRTRIRRLHIDELEVGKLTL